MFMAIYGRKVLSSLFSVLGACMVNGAWSMVHGSQYWPCSTCSTVPLKVYVCKLSLVFVLQNSHNLISLASEKLHGICRLMLFVNRETQQCDHSTKFGMGDSIPNFCNG